jgi:peptide/nickel transport system ATP-binding protein
MQKGASRLTVEPATGNAPSQRRETPVLSIHGLSVSYRRHTERLSVISDVSLEIHAGEAFGLVGESGCGKSTLAFAVMRYLARGGEIDAGSIRLDGEDVLALPEEALREVRGRRVAMVYQEPGSALNPSMRIGDQVAEVFRFHEAASKQDSWARAADMMEKVVLPDVEWIMRRYPHQLSGGQLQRVVIAMSLACNPRLLILDEPTTGLDTTVEAEVLDLIANLREEFDAAILFISHNLGLVARVCERVGVLYAGRMVEEGPAGEVFAAPRHPYTLGLIRSVPRFGAHKDVGRLEPIPGALPRLGAKPRGCAYAPRCPLARTLCSETAPALSAVASERLSRCHYWQEVEGIPPSAGSSEPIAPKVRGDAPTLIELKDVRKAYAGMVACDGVSLEIARGEIFGLVGESGSGKTTLARAVAGLVEPDSGDLLFNGQRLSRSVARRERTAQRAIQMVFQHPDTSLNPVHSARYVLKRAIDRLRGKRTVVELARAMQLDDRQLEAKTVRLSGGQKQRVAIGRAFAGNPQLVLCDEPVSALDVSVQAAILNLLAEVQQTEEVAYLFISHDLAVVRYLADRIGVMYLGELYEVGRADQVFHAPHHPYTEALVSAIPTLDVGQRPERIKLTGPMPSPANPPSGCRFHTRCPRKLGKICETQAPPWQEVDSGHLLRCHIPATDLQELQCQSTPLPVSPTKKA